MLASSAIDRDPAALHRGAALAAQHPGRLTLIEGRFGDMARLVATASPGPIAGIALDLGVSSLQLDSAERGFSFRLDGPLDMRMGADGESAADLVARLSEDELERLIRTLGEERFARRIARAIVAARRTHRFAAPANWPRSCARAVPTREPGLDPATRTFQALRLAVNDELGELERGLAGAERLLMPGGRLAVVSFHSLEDGRVKSFLRERSGGAVAVSRHMPAPAAATAPSFRLLGRRAVRPDAPRGRTQSARPLGASAGRRAHCGAAIGLRGAVETPPLGNGGVGWGIRGRRGTIA